MVVTTVCVIVLQMQMYLWPPTHGPRCRYLVLFVQPGTSQPSWPSLGHALDGIIKRPRLAHSPTRSFQIMAKVDSTEDNLYDGNFSCSLSLVVLTLHRPLWR